MRLLSSGATQALAELRVQHQQAQAAHEYMESNANLGKIVLHVTKMAE